MTFFSFESENIVICLDNNGVIIEFNHPAETVFGWKSANVIGKNFFQLCKKHNILCPIHYPISIPNVHKSNLQTCIRLPESKGEKNIQWNILALMQKAIEKPMIVMIGVDVTEYKKIEEKMDDLRNYFDTIINGLPHFIFWKDRESRFLGCNKKFSDAINLLSPRDIVGKSDYDMPWSEEQSANYIADDKLVMDSGLPRLHYEEVQQQLNGTQKIMLVSKVPLRDSRGQVVGVIGSYTDITARKLAEEELKQEKNRAEAANRAKTEFLENMRHDIRTPLSGIVNSAEMLKEEISDSKLKNSVDNLVASSHALMGFLNQILETVKLASDDVPLLKKKFSLHKNIQEVIQLSRAKASSKKLVLEEIYDESMPEFVIGDPIRVNRILLELIANALNFTHQGYVRVVTNLAKRNERDLIVRMMVEDSGIGIAASNHEEIFLRFKRLNPSYQGIYHGSGLGLSIVKQFIDDLQGEVYLESQLEQGARFTCLIPMKEALLDDTFGVEEHIDMPTVQQNDITIAPEIKSAKGTILIVEDHAISAQALKNVLSSALNCEVAIAPDGETAVEFSKQHEYDLILMDIGLPGIDGCEAARRIRKNEADISGHHVPIVALTAHVETAKQQECRQAGMDEILNKPLLVEDAKKLMASFLDQTLRV